ncbi:hypothetical protein NDU88_002249 [Pleurodeles waltl]|uniref:Uncharacterized protein n=1 Tax=Pleurodeles waltl TaxID=8319 RepID=A0AAV7SCE3_PLEWA|nr:hypothetical protein NDU88_002249 [Pleurodeles waltl]
MLDNCLLDGKDGVENWDMERKYNESNNGWPDVSSPNRIRKGDWVKIKVNIGMWKKFCGPFKVREVHRFFVVLENGERWNLRKAAKYGDANSVQVGEKDCFANVQSSSEENGCSSYMLMDDDSLIHNNVDGSVDEGCACHVREREDENYTLLRRTQRNHRTPAYLKDYVR